MLFTSRRPDLASVVHIHRGNSETADLADYEDLSPRFANELGRAVLKKRATGRSQSGASAYRRLSNFWVPSDANSHPISRLG